MRNLRWYLGIVSLTMFFGSIFAQQAYADDLAETCGLDAYYADDGAIIIDSFSLDRLADGEMLSPDPSCRGDKLYLCDGASGGTSVVKKKAQCDTCAANHCDGCCSYFCTTPACRTRCCSNECGTVC